MLPCPMRFGGFGIGLGYSTVPRFVVRFAIVQGTVDLAAAISYVLLKLLFRLCRPSVEIRIRNRCGRQVGKLTTCLPVCVYTVQNLRKLSKYVLCILSSRLVYSIYSDPTVVVATVEFPRRSKDDPKSSLHQSVPCNIDSDALQSKSTVRY